MSHAPDRTTPAARVFLPLLALILLAGSLPAGATCGSAQCFLVTGTKEGVLAPREFRVDLSYQDIDQSRRLSGTDSVGEVLTPKIDFEERKIEEKHHREIRTTNQLVHLSITAGLTNRMTFAATLPLVNNRDHEHYDDVGADPNNPGGVFTRSDDSSGFGDVIVGLRYAFLVRSRSLLLGGLSLKAPTGVYRLHDSEGSINEPSIMPGTGSWDWIGSVYCSWQVVPNRGDLFLSGSYRANSKNDLDYRMGDATQAHAGYRQKIGLHGEWSLQVNTRRTERDEYLGEAVHSTGYTYVNLSPGLKRTTDSGTSIYGYVQVPVYQDVNEEQLAPRLALLVGVSRSF
ncbi:MAG TPA: transporter [Candidatus Saccharimonadales bacterium]|nr:transporter [Candidatus Saccharimonadales bacterium]